MKCIVCKEEEGKQTYIEELSKEVVLCEECLDDIKNGGLDESVLTIAQGED